jgi:uncharacterized membrane protein YkvA (DUF1232 family)
MTRDPELRTKMRDFSSDLSDDFAPTREPDAADPAADEALAIQRPRLRRRARGEGRDRETIKGLIRDIPNFIRLLGALARDPRVSRVDKAIVLATIGYVLMPLDLIPDFLPFLGQIDDLYLLALALDRLLNNAGIDLLLEHWNGDVASLETAISALDRAGSFLPEQIRSLLRQRVR